MRQQSLFVKTIDWRQFVVKRIKMSSLLRIVFSLKSQQNILDSNCRRFFVVEAFCWLCVRRSILILFLFFDDNDNDTNDDCKSKHDVIDIGNGENKQTKN
jgi:hypothetical protein